MHHQQQRRIAVWFATFTMYAVASSGREAIMLMCDIRPLPMPYDITIYITLPEVILYQHIEISS
jgi:hypothetical protein